MASSAAKKIRRALIGWLVIPWLAGNVAAGTVGRDITLVSSHLAPYAMEIGEPAGLVVEMVRAIEARLGSRRPIHYLPWSRALKLVQQNPDHLIFPLTRMPEREADYRWLIKAAHIELAFLSAQGEPLSLEQARTLARISVQQDTPFQYFLERRGFDNLVAVADPAPVHLNLLASGRTQAWFTSTDQAHYLWPRVMGDRPLVLGPVVYRSDLYIATSKRFPAAVADAYREAFAALIREGEIQRIRDRYAQTQRIK
tara:strand:- start:1653 stop:2417 length:765 start_codon:yes stop_codon:yes gene_type:complete